MGISLLNIILLGDVHLDESIYNIVRKAKGFCYILPILGIYGDSVMRMNIRSHNGPQRKEDAYEEG